MDTTTRPTADRRAPTDRSAAADLAAAPAVELRGLTKTFTHRGRRRRATKGTTGTTGTTVTKGTTGTDAGLTADPTIRAVDGIDLVIGRGEVVALLGANGAGKTTTLDMLLGFTAPTSGSVRTLGLDPAQAAAAGRVGAVLQTGGLLPRLTVGETLALVASLFGRDDVEAVARAAGIQGLLTRRVVACSGGERQRLRFALALLPDPDLLVLDEPTTGMDVEGRRQFWEAIRGEAGSGRTILFATHYLAEADAIADRVVLMGAGRIVADDTPARLRALSPGRRVRATVDPTHDAAIRAVPGVTAFARHGSTLQVRSTDSDALARDLLTRRDARDLEIDAESLEDAFVALTHPTDRSTQETSA